MSELKTRFFDTHAHYYDDRFYGEENEQGAEALLEELFADGLLGVINVGTNAKSNLRAIEQAGKFPKMYTAVGIHPADLAHTEIGLDGELEALIGLLDADKREENKIVAIGEIGLDYYWEPYDKELQQKCFEAQLQLAIKYDLPVVIHDRDAHEDTLTLLQKYRPRGVLHCFSGSVEMMQEVVKLGMYVGLGGATTFKGAKKPLAVAAAVPTDRLLLETDAPYMAPVPCRGHRCDSRMIAHTAQVIAAARGIEAETLLKQTEQNTRQLFGL